MTLYAGSTFCWDAVCLGSPNPIAIRDAVVVSDVRDPVARWLAAAEHREDVVYFAVSHQALLVGQILLHDIDRDTNHAFIAYHLFAAGNRNRGIGTRALHLLYGWAEQYTNLATLYLGAERRNIASLRVAEKNGFVVVGPLREDPLQSVILQRDVPHPRQSSYTL